MEFMDGTWKKEINTWEELVGNNLLNQEAVIEGAVHSIRNMGDVAFIILRRREGLFQTVYENEMANVSIHELKEAMTIRVKGILHEEERAPHGRELRIRHIDILSTPAEPLPMAIDKWKLNTSLEAKLNYRPISLRNIQERSKFKIQEALTKAFRDYLYGQGFTEIHTPKIGARGAEGEFRLLRPLGGLAGPEPGRNSGSAGHGPPLGPSLPLHRIHPKQVQVQGPGKGRPHHYGKRHRPDSAEIRRHSHLSLRPRSG